MTPQEVRVRLRMHAVRARRLRSVAAAGALVAITAGGWQWWVYLHGPQRVASRFLTAIERHDVPQIHSLTMDHEKLRLGITPQVIEHALGEMFYKQTPRVRQVRTELAQESGLRAVNWYRQYTGWSDAATGKALPSPMLGTVHTITELFRSRDGRWEVSFTRFANSHIRLNSSWPLFLKLQGTDDQRVIRTRGLRRELLVKWGIPEVYPEPPMVRKDGRWVALLGTARYDPVQRRVTGSPR